LQRVFGFLFDEADFVDLNEMFCQDKLASKYLFESCVVLLLPLRLRGEGWDGDGVSPWF
jgi:hypothetical protein